MIYNNGFPTNQTYQQVQPIPNVGYTQYNQPVVQQPIQQNNGQLLDDRIKVNGVENAKMIPIAPNTIATIWDIDDKTFYQIVPGMPIKIYEYSEKQINTDNNDDNVVVDDLIEDTQLNFCLDDYVKKDDLDKYINDLLDKKFKDKNSIDNTVIKPQTTQVKSNDKVQKRQMNRTTKGDK